MNKENFSAIAASSKFGLPLTRAFIIGISFIFACAGEVFAQTDSTIDGATPPGVKPGAPAGSYPLSDFEQIDLYSGRLNIRLPSLSVGGRGAAAFNIPVKINQPPWVVEHDIVNITNPVGEVIGFRNQYYAAPNWWNNTYAHAFLPGGRLIVKHLGTNPSPCSGDTSYNQTNTHMVFIAPDGTEYEMRDQKKQGLATFLNCGGDVTRGKIYRTIDGTSATFILDSPDGQIGDLVLVSQYGGDSQLISHQTGTLLLGDGTRYKIGLNGRVDRMQDRNGNQINFYYPTTPLEYVSYPNRIVDSLNREILFQYDVQDGVYGLHDKITFRGFGGVERTIRVSYASLSAVLRSSAELCNGNICDLHELFPKLDSFGPHNPSRMVSAIWLPPDNSGNARSYQFKYNRYGEVARVVLPTGAAIEYDYTGGYLNGFQGGSLAGTPEGEIGEYTATRENSNPAPKIGIYRRLKERRVYPAVETGTAYEGRITYGSPLIGPQAPWDAETKVEVNTYGSLSNPLWLSSSEHYFIDEPITQLIDSAWGDGTILEGKEYKTIAYQISGASPNQQRIEYQKVEYDWVERYLISGPFHLGVPTMRATKTTMLDVSPPLVSRTASCAVTNTTCSPTGMGGDGFDIYGNQTDVWEYDYGNNAPGALLRHTRTSFVTQSEVNGLRYDTVNAADGSASNEFPDVAKTIHLRSLPFRQEVRTAADATIAATEYKYDEYGLTSYGGATITGWLAPGTAGRGNQTTVRRWQDYTCPVSPGTCQKSTWGGWTSGIWVEAHGWFDQLGNVTKTRDGNGNETMLEYDDRFGSPDGEARLNQPPTNPNWLNGAKTYAFPTKVINAIGHEAYTQYSYFLGKPVDAEDPNGVASSVFYDDYLDRPTQQVVAANQTSGKTQTAFGYDDANRIITVTSDQTAYGDNLLKGQTVYDGLGRTVEQRQYETTSTYIRVNTGYDAMGRVSQVSNPYRTGEMVFQTTTQYDSLGRVVEVKSPDNAKILTVYSGDQVTVSDQAGKTRRSFTDALGRLTQVVEDPNGSLNYQTGYAYDALDNLVRVTQGAQQRFFMYDSLSRLIRVKSPEQSVNTNLLPPLTEPISQNSQWAMAYGYDANGNLVTKTDANNITVGYTYDALNRNSTVEYFNTPFISPDITRVYDNPDPSKYGKGRLWKSYAGGTETSGAEVDATIIHAYDALGRPTSKEQKFKITGNWMTSGYNMQRTYNLAGAVTEQIYPAHAPPNLRKAVYEYDGVGRLSLFKGYLGDGNLRMYADALTYEASGQMSREHFGTINSNPDSSTGLYHHLGYNSRLQMTKAVLGTSATNHNLADRGRLNFFYTANARNAFNPSTVTDSGTDNNGNITVSQHIVATGAGDWIVQHDAYDYDALNRLERVSAKQKANNVTYDSLYVQKFDYDRWGNRSINQSETTSNINKISCQIDTVNNNNRFSGCANQAFQYDNAGNVTYDPTGAGGATYDAENRLITATGIQASGSVGGQYAYNADGQRTRFRPNIFAAQPKWKLYVYGFDGELVAEYSLQAAPGSPETEYGYRAGERLIIASGSNVQNPLGSSINLPVNNGGFETPSVGAGNYQFTPSGAGWMFTGVTGISGNGSPITAGNGASPEGAQAAFLQGDGASTVSQLVSGFDATRAYQISFKAAAMGEGRKPPVPASVEIFFDELSLGVYQFISAAYGSYVTPQFAAPKGKGTIRFVARNREGSNAIALLDDIRLTGLAQGTNNADVRWLVADHLGTPRMIVKLGGTLADVTRHDYLPFGEELVAGGQTPLRTTGTGYSGDSVRQKFTGYERDNETGLDFAQARYYANVQGRFTSVDPLMASGMTGKPQSWNRYSYSFNNPLRYTDPTGMLPGDYYDQEGRRIGTDGQNDGKAYLVTNAAEVQQIQQTERGRGTTRLNTITSALELPSHAVRQEIGSAAVARSNNPTGGNTPTDDQRGRFHEEGGIVVQTQNGQLAVPAHSGPVSDPSVNREATMDITNSVNPNLAAQATTSTMVTSYHVHPAGETKTRATVGSTTTETTHFFLQPPQGADRTFARNNPTSLGYHIVVGAGRNSANPGGQRVHFYNGNGVIGTLPLNRFVNIR